MFVNNINPVLFSIGPFGVRYYGLVYVVGFILGYLFLRRVIAQKKLKFTYDQLDTFFLWLILVSILMARLFDVFIYSWPDYAGNLSQMYQIWNGGLSFQGGLVGAIIVTLIFCKKYSVKFYDLADILVIPTAFTLFLGKLANYTNSELYGTITNPQSTPWCVVFAKSQTAGTFCRHPTQIYEAIANLLIFGILLWYYLNYHDIHHQNSKKQHPRGIIFWLFVLLYGLFRFIITFYRDEPLYRFMSIGLNVGQWLSLLMIIVSGIFLWRLWTHKSKNI